MLVSQIFPHVPATAPMTKTPSPETIKPKPKSKRQSSTSLHIEQATVAYDHKVPFYRLSPFWSATQQIRRQICETEDELALMTSKSSSSDLTMLPQIRRVVENIQIFQSKLQETENRASNISRYPITFFTPETLAKQISLIDMFLFGQIPNPVDDLITLAGGGKPCAKETASAITRYLHFHNYLLWIFYHSIQTAQPLQPTSLTSSPTIHQKLIHSPLLKRKGAQADPAQLAKAQVIEHLVRVAQSLWFEYGDMNGTIALLRTLCHPVIREENAEIWELVNSSMREWVGSVASILNNDGDDGGELNNMFGNYLVTMREFVNERCKERHGQQVTESVLPWLAPYVLGVQRRLEEDEQDGENENEHNGDINDVDKQLKMVLEPLDICSRSIRMDLQGVLAQKDDSVWHWILSQAFEDGAMKDDDVEAILKQEGIAFVFKQTEEQNVALIEAENVKAKALELLLGVEDIDEDDGEQDSTEVNEILSKVMDEVRLEGVEKGETPLVDDEDLEELSRESFDTKDYLD